VASEVKTPEAEPVVPPAAPVPETMPEPAPAPAPPQPAPVAYPAPDALLQELVGKLRAGDVAGFAELAGPKAAHEGVQKKLAALFLTRKFKVHGTKPPVELAAAESGRKYGIFLEAPAELAAVGEQQFQLDLVPDAAKGWAVDAVYAPDIDAVVKEKMAPAPPAVPVADANAPTEIARKFLNAVVGRDFRAAKLAADPAKLTDEKLAALFIVVEEGSFKPHDRNPLIGTAAGDNGAWVIARLKSDTQEADFGIEMARANATSPWKVVGLNFSKLIQMAAAAAGAGDIAYAPIKTDLQDGDQLVLYFEYDDDTVNPRAAKQLQIIADILKEDAKRKIHINGHTDALGTPDYNEALSDSRAASVRDILIAHGIPAAQIETKAYGMTAPKAPNTNPDGTDNPTGRAQNRRAEVYLAF
jgi:outer membrane protein OmpA-like peptidoglycan-associated protein